jgi:Ca2+-binding RTX toxin-like protein
MGWGRSTRSSAATNIALVTAVAMGLLVGGSSARAGEASRCDGVRATIVGTSGDDEIRGTPGRDVVQALGGSDRVWGLGGNDLLCGGRGGDRLYAGTSDDKAFGGLGGDRVRGGRGDDFVDVADMIGGNDFVSGEAGKDHCALDAAAGSIRPVGDEYEDDECESMASGIAIRISR